MKPVYENLSRASGPFTSVIHKCLWDGSGVQFSAQVKLDSDRHIVLVRSLTQRAIPLWAAMGSNRFFFHLSVSKSSLALLHGTKKRGCLFFFFWGRFLKVVSYGHHCGSFNWSWQWNTFGSFLPRWSHELCRRSATGASFVGRSLNWGWGGAWERSLGKDDCLLNFWLNLTSFCVNAVDCLPLDFDAITDPIMKAKMVALQGINKVMAQNPLAMGPMVMNR